MNTRIDLSALIAGCALAFVAAPAYSDAVSDFYKGKRITFIVGAGSGGGFGINARILSTHYGKYIPGNPTVVVQHMQGAGGGIAANYVYNVAAKDGSVIHMPVGATVQNNLLDPKKTRYKSDKFNWIGSIANQPYELAVWHTAPIRSIEEATRKQIILGAATGRSSFYQIPAMMNAVLGTKFKIITGYKGSRGVDLALERGEVQGRATSFASTQTRKPHWVKEKKIIRIAQVGAKPIPELTAQGVPRFIDLVKTPRQKTMVRFLHTSMKLGRSVNTPPDVPMARVEALRRAFDETMKDQAFRDDLKKKKMPFDPTPGAEIQSFIAAIMATPPDVVDEIRTVLKPPKRKKK